MNGTGPKVIITFIALSLWTGVAVAAERGGVVAPFDDGPILIDPGTAGDGGAIRGLGPGLQAGADHIVGQQCTTGAWCWEHGSACCPTPPYSNIVGPIGQGLLNAYAHTGDPAQQKAYKTSCFIHTLILRSCRIDRLCQCRLSLLLLFFIFQPLRG